MGPSGPGDSITPDDVLRVLRHESSPVSTAEVCESFECSRQTARRHLEALAEREQIRRKQVSESNAVWWASDRHHHTGLQGDDEQFSAFVSAVEDYAIFVLRPDGTIATWNEGAERIKGYEDEAIVGEHFSTFYTDEDIAAGVPERNLETAATEGRIEDEGWRVRADGSRFWANVTITAIRTDYGELRGFTKVTRDMTERREYEQQLEAQAERLERRRDELEDELEGVFERVDDAFYALDEEFRFEHVNDRAAEYLGTSAGELLGRTPWEVIDVDGDDPLFAKYETALATQEPVSFERYSEPLGMWEIVRVYPSESGLSVYFRDITERKRREQRLEELVERLDASNERLEQFAYAVSHDLQEPLRMVSSYLQLIERRYEDDLDEDALEYLDFAVDGADRMTEMIDGLLEYSRIETQETPDELVDLDAVLEDVQADLRFQIEEHAAEITTEDLPEVRGDKRQLRQLFQNLLNNAIEYSGAGPPRVHISAAQAGAKWQISVRDEGIGIDPADQERIFEIFQRLHTREEQEGTGIGLALCERIVTHHGGQIQVESEPGGGTTFTVSLPTVDDT